jgi:uncharacterized protein (TIGR03435 family)
MRAIVSLAVFAGSCAIWAQADPQLNTQTPGSPRFLATDVHPAPVTTNQAARGPFLSGQRYDLRNASMVDLISKAYGVPADKVLEGPSWLEFDRYDIAASIPPRTTAADATRMLQALLVERFGVVLRQEERQLPAFVLTAPKGSQKLKQADGSGNLGCGMGISSGPKDADGTQPTPVVSFNCRNTSMSSFAANLATNALARDVFGTTPVQDKTGIEGTWDFVLKFPLAASGALTSDASTFFDAADKQLGLKFERDTVKLPVIVVEKANRIPSPNASDLAQKIPQPAAEFEVATIRPFEQGTGPNFMGTRIQPGGRVEISGMPLKSLIQQAWSVQTDAIVGATKWMDSDRYTIVARMAGFEGPPSPTGNSPFDSDTLAIQLRALLTDRFQIKAHFEDRPATAYTLTASKQPKLKAADPNSRAKLIDSGGPIILNAGSAAPRTVKIQNMTMAQFAEKLQVFAAAYIHAPVIEATGLQGSYDFSLSFSALAPAQLANLMARPAEGTNGAADPIGGVTLFDAVEKQLGLKLVEQKRPVKMLVIDHIEEKPTEN